MHIHEILLQILTTVSTHLDYAVQGVTDLDLQKICEHLLHNPSVKSISLWMNKITDEGVPHIIAFLNHPCCVIEKMDLSINKISVDGINLINDTLAKLKSERGREIEIDLSRNCANTRPSLALEPFRTSNKIGYRPS